MLKLTKNGAYSDITVIFNKKEYKLHILLLAEISEYFNCVYKNTFKDKNLIEINFEQIDGKLLDNKYFDIWINSIYQNVFDASDIIIQSSFIDIIEFHRLLDYFKHIDIEKYDLRDIIKKKLDDIKSIKNDMDEFVNDYTNKTILKYIGRTCGNMKYNTPGFQSSCICTGTIGVRCSYSCALTKYYDKIKLPSELELGTNFYKIDEKITCEYVKFLFKLVDDDIYKEKIIGISNIQLKDISEFDVKFHKLILKIIMNKL